MIRSKLFPCIVSGVLCVLLGLCGDALAENAVKVGTGTASDSSVADIPLRVSGDKDIQGFQIIFEWNGSNACGVDVLPADGAGEALEQAEMIQKRETCTYMILAAVMDVDGTGGEKIPAGQDIRVGTARIRCNGPAEGSRQTELKLVDNKYAAVDGGPLLANLIVSEGLSIGANEGLKRTNGSITCQGEGPGPSVEVVFACGGPLGPNNQPTDVSGKRGARLPVTFFYRSPDSSSEPNRNRIQGLSMAVKYHCDLTAHPDSFDLEDSQIKLVNSEFVHLEVDNIAGDGDPCEFTLGVLVDAVAPYDGRTLPATFNYKKLFSLDFEIEMDADCGECLWVKFFDELNGNGDVFVYNLVSMNFYPQKPKLVNCEVCVDKGSPKFTRGDCNFTFGGKRAVDISDAAAMVGYFFLQGNAKFEAPCDDACDANDDGKLDASDVIFILNYLFVPGKPKPPPPTPPNVGQDPTNDSLGCEGGTPVC